ncbi:hypothetical protein HDV00_001944 [Rhizophlyctis rosea]|nr:hypothetical protein HDV00_001944 [Rhizophlyctis rosea]
MVKFLLTLSALVAAANAHYWIDNVDGQTTCLRDLAQYQPMNPITGNNITTDDVICGVMRPLYAADVKPACAYAAGGKIKAHYQPGLSTAHPGPCVVYASAQTTAPFTWTKIYYEGYNEKTKQWCQERVIANNNVFDFPIPSNMAAGRYLFRIEHIALHVAATPGGVQLYPRCVDIQVSGGGSVVPNQGQLGFMITSDAMEASH